MGREQVFRREGPNHLQENDVLGMSWGRWEGRWTESRQNQGRLGCADPAVQFYGRRAEAGWDSGGRLHHLHKRARRDGDALLLGLSERTGPVEPVFLHAQADGPREIEERS